LSCYGDALTNTERLRAVGVEGHILELHIQQGVGINVVGACSSMGIGRLLELTGCTPRVHGTLGA
jgi:hypothetical protein